MTAPAIKTHEVDDEPASLGEFCGIQSLKMSKTNLQPHSRCSETFYKKEIEIGVKSGSSKSEEDRNKMLELLKRIEDENAADEVGPPLHADEENEQDAFALRFSAINMSSASADDIIRLLNKKEKDKFFSALKDPSSGLMQELLGSAELAKTSQLPWWEAHDGGQPSLSPRIPYGVEPDLMVIPTDLINQSSRGTSLLYNICVVLLAYAYVTRHLSMSPLGSTTNDPQDQQEARRIILQSIPFLRDRKSKLLHVSLNDGVTSFWSQLDSGSIDKKAILVLLGDVAKFVRPRRIIATGHFPSGETEKTFAADHPFTTTIMVLSDMSSLFSIDPGTSVVACRRSHVVMKLTFYAAYILSIPPSHLHALADEVHLLSKSMGREAY